VNGEAGRQHDAITLDPNIISVGIFTDLAA